VQEGAVKSNPWTAVRKVGKAKRGKEQLTIDEARTFMAYCESRMMFDDGALVGLLALLCGLRESEIIALTVRSVDDNGRKLRISKTKTEAGKRVLALPDSIQPAIEARRINRADDAPLIPHVEHVPGSARTWVYREIHKMCRGAGVPVVCPHGLRGGLASLAYEAGILPQFIRDLLGHTSSDITERHYATPAAVEGAKMKRHLGVLQGGKPA
jgi:integrase